MPYFRPRVLAAALVFAAGGASAHTNERGIDPQNFDESIGACTDFFQHANGGWLKSNPIPAEYSQWSLDDELRERNLALLRGILEDAAKNAGASPAATRARSATSTPPRWTRPRSTRPASTPIQATTRARRRAENAGRCRDADPRLARRRHADAVRLRPRSRHEERVDGHRLRDAGRPRHAGPRLLPARPTRNRRRCSRNTARTSRACSASSAQKNADARSRLGARSRDDARQGVARSRRAARTREFVSHLHGQGRRREDAAFLVDEVLRARSASRTSSASRSRNRISSPPPTRRSRACRSSTGRRICAGIWSNFAAPALSKRFRRRRLRFLRAARCAAPSS